MTNIEQLQARLEKVQAAIDAALTGKRYRIKDGEADRELERQPLDQLLNLESRLQSQIAQLSGTGGRVRFGMPV